MKVLALCGTVALSQTTGEVFETTTVNPFPHDPVAMQFCESGCAGTDYEDPAGHCFDGFYPYPDECSKYIVCWDEGLFGDAFDCAGGLVWNQRYFICDWPYNLSEDHPCYSS
ncbi:unnamed protein product [Oikopleura dioica]|uniref:chitinase n=1 Tax=Oikopleura dioica TaxID=34765 RepID=E4YRF4_OIKDI|nr:unnamed protein product [Oikopleura dioica]